MGLKCIWYLWNCSLSLRMEEEAVLIDVIQCYEFLYDKSSQDYKNNNKKENAWKAISEAMQLPVADVQRMWRLLRDRYTKERRILKTTPSGSSPKDSGWILYRAMNFMEPHLATRKRTSNIQQTASGSKKSKIVQLQYESASQSPASSGETESHPWHTYNIITEREDDACEGEDSADVEEEVQPGPSHRLAPGEVEQRPLHATQQRSVETPLRGETPRSAEKRSYTARSKRNAGVETQIGESLAALTSYLSQPKTAERNTAFGQYVGMSLAEMPLQEQNYKRLKIVELLNAPFIV